jgi:hypothetical protein
MVCQDFARRNRHRGPLPSTQRAPDGEEFFAPLAANGFSVEAGKLLKRVGDGLPG